ncbi:MAG: hypothetical protein NWE94_02355 [Candidatus Bathyarchaeota archaeon]|nr:hypothetical protein [Candidatus Bathyarchaeota archaeon]
MKQKQTYVLDLTRINGNGDFACPRCGATISPDDCTEETYSVTEAKVSSQGLEELVICCNKCTSHLHLTGFSLLQNLCGADEEKDKESDYITHL